MYKKINFNDGFVKLEKDVYNLWEEKDIVKKNLKRNKDGEYFTFYDGPPTANGSPHIGHVLTRAIKDIIPRYKVMQGYNVPRKAGWDTHGLPVELEIEKSLGISGKSEIEEYGIENFIKKCKESVFKYVNEWEDMSNKVGFWADMDNPYVTYHNDYIESVWWSLRQMWDKDLIYKGHKVMPYCPRCGTALSSHEVAQGYKDVTDQSATVKFQIKGEENKYILAWTTTPWTLPSNTALTINKSYTYVEAKKDGEILIIAKNLVSQLGEKDDYEIIKEFKGEELLGTEYNQLIPYVQPEGKAFIVLHGDYVTLESGTGIVHTAPAYGEDDSMIAALNDIASLHLVDEEGKFIEGTKDIEGLFVKDADKVILKNLKESGELFKSDSFLHSYPHCWRCDTPLLYYPKDSWFIASTKYKKELVSNNQKINWLPDNIKDGRFGNFLDSVIDWAISRDRYWGTPLPIWECEDCGHRHMVGSIKELHEMGVNVKKDIELHKPYIDEVKLNCEKCTGVMTRVSEVIDAWYDSGSMPFAQHHYPFENKELFSNTFPADFISEAMDQTRGWFYTLHNISTAVFESNAYSNCIVMGLVTDKTGQKMSKSKGNAVSPDEMLDVVGADAIRWHFYSASAPWMAKRLSEDDVRESQRKYLLSLSNVYSFYTLYADIDKFNPMDYKEFKPEHIMDKWVLSRLNSVVKELEDLLNRYLITPAANLLEDFIEEVSNWYIRRNRARFWQDNMTDDKIGAYQTLHTVIDTLSKISAPFVPFTSEAIYQSISYDMDNNLPESVHLTNWPEINTDLINNSLEEEMKMAMIVVGLGRSARNTANIKNRQPLLKMQLSTTSLPEYYADIIKDELNVKSIEFGANMDDFVSFDIKPNLPVIGKMYGKYIPQIRKALAQSNQKDLAQAVYKGDAYILTIDDGVDIELNKDNILVEMNGLEGFAFASEGDVGVILDTVITEELKKEGYLREILSKIQNQRKDHGFNVEDRIDLYVYGDDSLLSVIDANKDYIKKEVLADNILKEKFEKSEDTQINDKKMFIGVKNLSK